MIGRKIKRNKELVKIVQAGEHVIRLHTISQVGIVPLVVLDFVKLSEQLVNIWKCFQMLVLNRVAILLFMNKELNNIQSSVQLREVSDGLLDPFLQASSTNGSLGLVDQLVDGLRL